MKNKKNLNVNNIPNYLVLKRCGIMNVYKVVIIMAYKMVTTFNKFEKEIHDMCINNKIDYERIDYLLKNGASANAIETTEWDNGEIEEDLLLTQCWLDSYVDENGEKKVDEDFNLKILNIFIDNGLDIDKYVNHIFENIHFTYDDKHYVQITKTILNHIKNKDSINLESSLNGIGTEESYNNCCTQNHKYANSLSTIYEMIEKYYEKNLNPNKYYECDKAINQKIKDIKIFCKDIKLDQPRTLICDDIDIFIECEEDILCILNKYIFVNNNDIMSEYELLDKTSDVTKDNAFGHSILEYAQGEKIIEISFTDCPVNSAPKTTIHTTVIDIKLTNDKAIRIKTDEAASFMKVILK